MSVYNLEPQPTGKVILQTTAGDISLELFAKQTPLASRNFLQHCLDGYYNGTIFHRLVPNFIIQGGDPTGTGSGGISAIDNGESFRDEFHSRLKFNRRGLLGMANEGKDNNGSQFFLTLAATPELQGKHTMFGRVEGDTIFNVLKMAEAELIEGEGSERPMYPTRVTGAEILVNPFEDMVARVREAPRTNEVASKKDVKKRKKPLGKNGLSFGADDGDEDSPAPVLKKFRANPKLVQQIEETEKPVDPAVPKAQREKKREPQRQSSIAQVEVQDTLPPKLAEAEAEIARSESDDDDDDQVESADDPSTSLKETQRRAALAKTNAEIEALKQSMRREKDARDTETRAPEKPPTAIEAMIPATSTRGRKRGKPGGDEKGALAMFKAFKARLADLPSRTAETSTKATTDGARDSDITKTAAGTGAADEEAELCDLHFIANCQSCKDWADGKDDGAEAEAEIDDNPGWMAHKLSFAKDTLGKDLEWKRKMEELELIDPREKARAIKEEKRRGQDVRKKR